MNDKFTTQNHEDLSVIKVTYHEGEENPWSLDYHDVSLFQAARAALNYPVTRFDSREKALEVATMIRDIVKADAVHVEGEMDVILPRDPEDSAPFFETISNDGPDPSDEDL